MTDSTATATATTNRSVSLISWTATGGNKLKEYELVTKGLDIKLKLEGDNFTEWLEAIATHARTIGMLSLFDYGSRSIIVFPVHESYASKKSFFKSYGAILLEHA